jgi:aminomethyltransferase
MVGKKLPLNDWHAQNGARFVEEGGWQIPESYGKVELEYAALRNGVGFVDLCYEARFRVEGRDAGAFLNTVLTTNAEKLAPKWAGLAYLCNDRGGVQDQVTVYRDENYFLLLGSGRTRIATIDWLRARQEQFKGDVAVDDVSTTQGQLALRGQGAPMMLERIAFGQKFALDPGNGMVVTIGTARALVLRRPAGIAEGYDLVTGSIYLQPLWDKFAEAARATGARPVGLAAREIFRVESGFPRNGMEFDGHTMPTEVESGLAIDYDKGNFAGRRALLHATAAEFKKVMVGLRLDANSAVDAGGEILFDNMPIGRVTSTVVSPVLRARLGLGFVNPVKAAPGTPIRVRGRGDQLFAGEVIRPGDLTQRK